MAESEPAWLGLPFDRIGLVLGPLVLLGWIFLVDPGDLTPQAHRLAGIMLLTIIWWLTEPIPIPVTGLLAVSLCVFLGVVTTSPARTVLAPFADPSVFFLLGGVFIGRAMTRHGLDRRLALSILCTRWAGRSQVTVLFAVGLSVGLVSMWISNTAATAMMYPVTLGIIAVLSGQSPAAVLPAEPGARRGPSFARSPYASALLLMTAYASSVGGVSTPIGTATNVTAKGFFEQAAYLNRSIDFVKWCQVGVPLMAIMFVGLFGWMWLHTARSDLNMTVLRDYLQQERRRLGPWKRGEINTLIVFLCVIGLWVAPAVLPLFSAEAAETFKRHVPEEIAALMAPVLLFLLPTNFAQRQFTLEASDLQKVDWGTMLLFGAGLSLGTLMAQTGLARIVGQNTFDLLGTRDLWAVTALAITAGIVFSEFTGNVPALATIIPVIYPICLEAGVDPVLPLLGATFGASFGSALPVSTPPNAIVYSSGLIPVRRMIRAGLGLDLIAGVVIWIVLRVAHWFLWSPFVS
jgi:sodium-dependent dicarboxylate transporter 2/3/5